MRRIGGYLAIVLTLLAASPLRAQTDDAYYTTVAGWDMRMYESGCTITRNLVKKGYTTPDETMTVAGETFHYSGLTVPDEHMTVTLARRLADPPGSLLVAVESDGHVPKDKFKLTIGGYHGENYYFIGPFDIPDISPEPQKIVFSLSAKEAPQVIDATGLFFAASSRDEQGSVDITFGDERLHSAGAALDRCVHEIGRQDAGSGKPASTTPQLKPVDFAELVSRYYPESALKSEAQGRTVVSLDVSAKGQASACFVQTSSGNDDLDEATCVAMEHLTFIPATDAEGNATRGEFTQAVTWTAPQ